MMSDQESPRKLTSGLRDDALWAVIGAALSIAAFFTYQAMKGPGQQPPMQERARTREPEKVASRDAEGRGPEYFICVVCDVVTGRGEIGIVRDGEAIFEVADTPYAAPDIPLDKSWSSIEELLRDILHGAGPQLDVVPWSDGDKYLLLILVTLSGDGVVATQIEATVCRNRIDARIAREIWGKGVEENALPPDARISRLLVYGDPAFSRLGAPIRIVTEASKRHRSGGKGADQGIQRISAF